MQSSVKLSDVKLSETVQQMLRCPICKARLVSHDEHYQCKNSECNFLFPIINGIPILIDEDNSVFSLDDFINQNNSTFFSSQTKLVQTVNRFLPDILRNIKGRENYNKLTKLLLGRSSTPKVLVIGGSILGEGMEAIIAHPNIESVDSDVTFGPRTKLVCDAHSIPFEDNSFDGVIVQAVLEHVVDPWRCVEEIHRVLKEDGLVYAETPFMQQVHGGRYDFTRFTHLGHRRLFRKFEEIDSGAVCGPAMALAWSYRYFLLSFASSSFLRRLIGVFVRLTSFYLTYLDYLLIDKPGTLDAASGYYFIGRKSNRVLPDKDLIKLYKGLDQT
jgi:SAM-dependent methyltransferase